MTVTHLKGGNIVWTCVKDNIISKKDLYEYIGPSGFDYKLFNEEEGGGTRYGLDGYTYLKNIIKFRPGD